MNLSDITILKIKNVDYRCIISGMSKIEVINILQNIDLTGKVEHYIIKNQEQFSNCKFTLNSNLNEKSGKL